MNPAHLFRLLQSAAAQPLGLAGLVAIAVALLARLRVDRSDGNRRIALWTILAAGIVSFGAAFASVLPRAEADDFARVHGRAVAFGKIIEDGDAMPGVEQFLDTDRPDVTRATGDQDVHTRTT